MSTNYQFESIFFKNLHPSNIIHYTPHHGQHSNHLIEKFEQNFQQFLTNRQQKNKKLLTAADAAAQQKKFKLNEMKKDFIKINEIIENLKTNEYNLRQNINQLTPDEWTESFKIFHNEQKSIESQLTKYENPLTLNIVNKTISQRHNKRLQLKRLKANNRKQHKIIRENYRQDLHKKIDLWQLKSIADDKMKIEEKQQNSKRVPQVLGGVAKKKLEAKKYLDVLDSLIDLRRARLVQSGKIQSIGENYFIERINRLKAVWIDALQNYDNDEDELKKILNNNKQSIECEWNRALFNVAASSTGLNYENSKIPMFKGNYNLDDFISIRYTLYTYIYY